MRNVCKIMTKELLRWSNMAVFYVLFGILLFCVGLYTWFFNEKTAFFAVDRIVPACLKAMYWGLAVFMPLLATGVIMEERKSKMLRVLLSKPISITALVLGKLGAIKCILLSLFAFTLLYYFSTGISTEITVKYLFQVYLFLFFMGMTYAVISMSVACFFSVYWKSYLGTYAIIFSLHFLANTLGDFSMGEIQTFFNYIGIRAHFEYFLSGGFALSALVYMGSLIFIGLFTIIYKLSRDNS